MKTLCTLFVIFSALAGFAQTRISGKITDAQGEPVALANILLLDTYDGTSSDADGNFQFTTMETGTKILVVKYVGFHDYQQPLDLKGEDITIVVGMKEQINELNAVTISAGAFTASDASRRTVFRAVDIATTAGATADIAGALNTLPGTQKVGESGRLFVRGGDGNEARTFIDGMVVLDAYTPTAPNTPSRGRFLPFMFKGTSFSTGGCSAEYGQALSSALVLDSKDQTEFTRTDIGILSVGGDISHTRAWKGGSAAGKISYTNLRPYMGLINQRIDWKNAPVEQEGIVAVRQKICKNGMFKFYGNFNTSNFSLYNHDIDNYDNKQLYDLHNKYRYINTSYKDVLNDNWSVRGGVSYTSFRNEISLDEKTKIKEEEQGVHAKTVFEGSLTEHVELKTGVEVISRAYDRKITTTDPFTLFETFNETIFAGFAETDLYASNNFVTRAGGRVEYNSLIGQWSFDPRFSLAYKTGTSSQISLAYGKFRQSAKNNYVRINNDLASEKADHFILNYQRTENNRTFRIETYYKRYSDLVKFENGDASLLSNKGKGYAQGVELFWRDNASVRNLDYWISYTYLDTKRDYLNFPYEAVPSFASRHNFSVVGKYFIQKIKSQLGATYSISSGRPYYNPNDDKFHANRTPSYQDLSFNWSYLPKPSLIIYFSCTNLLGYDNIFGYEYSPNPNSEGVYNSRAIRQPAPRFVFLGILITLSKDKSLNQLPTL
ncbi:MAG: TonB-dependent receptor [Bacteroidota bacterium]